MTGYAALDREGRRWELRSVNARGLDLRLRLPDRPAGLEPAARAALSGVARGNVTLSLRLGGGGGAGALDGAVQSLLAAEAAASAAGLDLRPATAADVLTLAAAGGAEEEMPLATLKDDLADLAAAFDADRRREGAALRGVLSGQVEEIADLTARAAALGPARATHIADAFRSAMARLTETAPDAGLDPARAAQEVAALAVKGDVTEEIDRLGTHVAAA
ncbi:MAG: YicC/YloC family endoribonuclease, partial [Pseudomonadota bacterium]